jgi:RNA-directed DNA polymerase
MSYKTLERLEYLRKANSNRSWINNELYRLMYQEDLYIIAIEQYPTRKRANFREVFHDEKLDLTTKKGKQMTEELQESSTGAPFHGVTNWHDLDWKSVSCNVRRLQTRIVKATQEKRWDKVKALQRLLTHSFSGKALAVRRVTENQGKNTPGVDKITWNTPHKKINAVYSLRQRDYHPQPLRRISIPKMKARASGSQARLARAAPGYANC